MEKIQRSKSSGLKSWIWLIQAFSGLLLIVLLALHMVANHFVVEGGLRTYQDVLEYLSNPVILVLEIAFLISVTAHAALGVRAIILDLGLSPAAERNMNVILTVLSVAAIVYGIWLSLLIQSRA